MSQHTRQAEYTEARIPDAHREVRLETERPPRFELRFPQILAGALAAASAAVAASWLGVAGTVLGAVVASIVVSITSAIYSHPIEKSTQVIREVLPVRPDPSRLSGGVASTQTLVLDASRDGANDPAEQSELTSTSRPVSSTRAELPRGRRRIPWGTVLASSVLTLIVGFGILTAFETVFGRPASSLIGNNDGGTTVGRIFDGGSGGSGSEQSNTPAPTNTGPTEETPTTTGSTDSPTTDDPTVPPSPEPTPTEPTPTEPTPTEPTSAQPTNSPATGADEGAAELVAAGG